MKLSRLQIITALKEQNCTPSKKEFKKKFCDYVCEEMKLNPKLLNEELKVAADNASQKYRKEGT